MSLTARAIAVGLLVLALVAGWWRLTAHYEARGYQRRAAEDAAAMQEQADRNQELQRAAEKRYTVATEVRDRFIVETVTEIRHETANLAACVLTPAARQRLHDAAACASGNPAASCGAGEPLPVAR